MNRAGIVYGRGGTAAEEEVQKYKSVMCKRKRVEAVVGVDVPSRLNASVVRVRGWGRVLAWNSERRYDGKDAERDTNFGD